MTIKTWLAGLLKLGEEGELREEAEPLPDDNTTPPSLGDIVLGGRYNLELLIGRGSSAVVYRAKDTVLEQTVAIKVMLFEGILSTDQAKDISRSPCARRPARPCAWDTPTSSASTTTSRAATGSTWSWSTWSESTSTTSSSAAPTAGSPPARPCSMAARPSRPWSTPTAWGWCTTISSPATSSSPGPPA